MRLNFLLTLRTVATIEFRRRRTPKQGPQRMQLQHVNVKLLVQNRDEASLDPLIPVFHGWIENQAAENELLIDVADYSHVPAGPGVVLIGHEGNYSVDNTGNRLGIRYNCKTPLDGSNEDRLKQAARVAL